MGAKEQMIAVLRDPDTARIRFNYASNGTTASISVDAFRQVADRLQDGHLKVKRGSVSRQPDGIQRALRATTLKILSILVKIIGGHATLMRWSYTNRYTPFSTSTAGPFPGLITRPLLISHRATICETRAIRSQGWKKTSHTRSAIAWRMPMRPAATRASGYSYFETNLTTTRGIPLTFIQTSAVTVSCLLRILETFHSQVSW